MPKAIQGTIFLLWITGWCLGLQAGSNPQPRVKILSECQVTGRKVYLSQVVSTQALPAALAEKLNGTLLTTAPVPGKNRVLAGSEIGDQLASLGVTPEKYHFQVPAEVIIRRESQIWAPQELEARLTAEFLPTLNWKEVRLEKIDLSETLELPVGKTVLHYDCSPRTDFAHPFYLGISFQVDGEVVKRLFLRTTLSILEMVPVLNQSLKPQDDLSAASVRWEKRPLDSTLHAPVRSEDYLEGKRVRYSLPAGTVLTEDLLVSSPLVRRGDMVTLVYQDEKIRITTQGRSLGAASRGEKIRVINADSKKELMAEVVDAKTVRVLN